MNIITAQLLKHVPVISYDTMNQVAPVLVPQTTNEELRLLNFEDDRRNVFTGPSSMTQLEWIRACSDHLMETLGLEPVTMNALIQVCNDIVNDGRIVSVPSLIERLQNLPNQSHRALLNRLLPLVIANEQVFGCARGFDLGDLLSRSLVFNLKTAGDPIRRLIYNDHLSFLIQERRQLPRWSLKTVFVFTKADRCRSGDLQDGHASFGCPARGDHEPAAAACRHQQARRAAAIPGEDPECLLKPNCISRERPTTQNSRIDAEQRWQA